MTLYGRRYRVHRANVFGHIINDKDQIRHRERLTTRPEAVACDK